MDINKDSIIRYLLPKIKEVVELNGTASEVFNSAVIQNKLYPKATILTLLDCTLQARVNLKSGKIVFGENFLCYLWTAIYFSVVSFSYNTKKALGSLDDTMFLVMDRAIEAFEWGNVINCNKHSYPNSCPTPENIQEPYVVESNVLFCIAVEFITLHELGHILLNHKEMDDDIISKEIEADAFACNKLISGITSDSPNYKITTLGGLSALIATLLGDLSPMKSKYHPSTFERLSTYIDRFTSDSNDELWARSCHALFCWAETYSRKLFFPDAENFKECYNQIVQQLIPRD